MNEEFAAYMQARLEELVAGQRFHRRRSAALEEPRVYRAQLPGRDADYAEGDYAPSVCWSITGGRTGAGLLEFTVILTLTVWTPGEIAEGAADIERLLRAVLGIAGDTGCAGHRLSPTVEFRLGQSDSNDYLDGVQPHPYHQAYVKLQFSAPNRRNHCNQ